MVQSSVATPTDTETEQLGEVRGRESEGRPAGNAASAEGSGPDPGAGVWPAGEPENEQVKPDRK